MSPSKRTRRVDRDRLERSDHVAEAAHQGGLGLCVKRDAGAVAADGKDPAEREASWRRHVEERESGRAVRWLGTDRLQVSRRVVELHASPERGMDLSVRAIQVRGLREEVLGVDEHHRCRKRRASGHDER